MAEICVECWEKINKQKFRKNLYVLSKDLDLCECCGQWNRVIISTRKNYCLRFIKRLFKKDGRIK